MRVHLSSHILHFLPPHHSPCIALTRGLHAETPIQKSTISFTTRVGGRCCHFRSLLLNLSCLTLLGRASSSYADPPSQPHTPSLPAFSLATHVLPVRHTALR